MSINDNNNNTSSSVEDEELLFDTLDDDDEDEVVPVRKTSGSTHTSYPAAPVQDIDTINKKLSDLEKFKQREESKLKEATLYNILNQYDTVDPQVKSLFLDLLRFNNGALEETTKFLTDRIEDAYTEASATKKDVSKLSGYMSALHEHLNFKTGIRKALEGQAKKASVKEKHVEEAIKTHEKKLKDPSYKFKVESIWRDPELSGEEKQLLIQQSAVEGYVESLKSKKAKKTKAGASLELKKNPTEAEAVTEAKQTLAENLSTAKTPGADPASSEMLAETKKKMAEKLGRRFGFGK